MNSTPLRMSRSSLALAACLAGLLLIASCASGEPVDQNLEPGVGGSAGVAGTAGSAGTAGKAGSGNKGGAAGASGGGGSAGAGGAGQAGAAGAGGLQGTGGSSDPNCHLLINEIQTGASSGSDEFIEIFNPCAAPEDLTKWKLVYRSAAGTSDTTLFDLSALSIGSQDYLVIGGSGYTGGVAVDGTYTAGGMAAAGGGIALRDATGGTVDSIAYGSATNGFVEGGTPPEAPADGSSLARVPNGADTDNNATDFQQVMSPTPGSAN